MTTDQASRVVLITGAGMATFVMLHASRTGRPREKTFRSLWAVGVLTLGLGVFADFAPKVAGPFALLVLIAMAARNSGEIGAVIGGPGSPSRSSGPGSSSRPKAAGSGSRKR